MGDDKITCLDIEIAMAHYFNPRVNLIVPNISWGMMIHECDLLILTPSNYAYEVEIKVSKYDLIKDKEKRHKHQSDKIKKLYFAIPNYLLESCLEHIPERAGILTVAHKKYNLSSVKKIREAQVNSNYQFTVGDRYMIARLGVMRTWRLREQIQAMREFQ
jgi:hypothetical protein